MPRSEFEKLANEGYDKLPDWVRKKIDNVAVLIEDAPSQELRDEEKLGPHETLLGIYQGVPRNARAYGASMELPDRITLFQLPIEEVAREEHKDVRDVVTETIWHEFAHYFGMVEQEVRARESERDNS